MVYGIENIHSQPLSHCISNTVKKMVP